MKTLAGLPLLLSLVACANLNPSAMAQAAGAGALKQIQEGKGLTAEGLAKVAAEGAGIPTDAEGLAKAAGLPTVPGVPGMPGVPAVPGVPGVPTTNSPRGATSAAALLAGSKGNALTDTANVIATTSAIANAAAEPRPSSNTASAKSPPASPGVTAQPSRPSPSPSPALSPASSSPPSNAAAQNVDVAGANVRIAKLDVDDVHLNAVSCRLAPGSDVSGLFGPAVIGAGFRERRARLDACSRSVVQTRVTWVASGSKTVTVRATSDDPKINACVERALAGSVAMVDGTCAATLTHGKSK